MALLPDGLVLRFPRRIRLSFAAILLLTGLSAACAPSIHDRNAVHLLKANSEVNPVMERYIDRGIDEAERTDAKAVVIRLDTPGGLSTSMEHIVQRIQSSKVPVIVYVSPSGGKAASAGTFITISAHVAAMAPGSETREDRTPRRVGEGTEREAQAVDSQVAPLTYLTTWFITSRRRGCQGGW